MKVHHLDGTQHFQLPQQGKREIGESPMGFPLSRLEVIQGTSVHIKLARTSHMALLCVVIDVPWRRRELDVSEHL